MLVTVDVPDSIARQLRLDGKQGTRRALEIFALEGYRAGELSRGQVSELLELEFNETEQFLRRNNVPVPLTRDEHEREVEALAKLLGR